MDKNLRVQLLKAGGKKKLKAYNDMRRIMDTSMNLGTRVHPDKRYKDPKHKKLMEYA